MPEKHSFQESLPEKEKPEWRRMPILIETDQGKQVVWVRYLVEIAPMKYDCVECGQAEQTMPCENVKEVVVETQDDSIRQNAESLIKALVDRHERDMFVCHDCLNADFLTKRLDKYVAVLGEARKALGIALSGEDEAKYLANIRNSDKSQI